MSFINNESTLKRNVLATDLDGTLIPLPDSSGNQEALDHLTACKNAEVFQLIFCTGRHFTSVKDAISHYQLPLPEWIICDVGTTIYKNQEGAFQPFDAYTQHLKDLTVQTERKEMESLLDDLPDLNLQQEDHQGEFKISYECESSRTDDFVEKISGILEEKNIPFQAHGSIDPFLHCGLIDLLPRGVSKSYALSWLATYAGYEADQVIYAGDSGNDYLALTSGCRAIVVANASKGLLEKVKAALKEKNKSDALYAAKESATSGVLEGCKHFGWI